MTTKKFTSLPGASRVLPPPAPGDNAKRALNRYGVARGEDGRVMRSTGRDVQFATIVTPEFKDWIKTEAKRRGKRMCVLLEDMRAAYEKIHSSGTR
jgi:hypothetical protein